MKKIILSIPPLLLLLIFGVVHPGWSQDVPPDYYEVPAQGLLSPAELDDLLAPIALYPDPLIAQILPAATFADQIDQAARFVRQYGNTTQIDNQPWDLSVKAIAHYPDVLFMMDRKYDWTVSLGQAYIEQPQDVMESIQRLRAEAQAQGNLFSTPKQQVIVEPDYIRIVPATPQYLYVPVYDPDVVYFESYDPFAPFITFSTGFFIGAWLSRDCDWRRHRVYYHGWRGGGWVGRARPHIHDRRGIYINQRASVINVNNRVLQQDTRRYREQLHSDSIRRRQGPMVRPGQPGQHGAARGQRPPRSNQGQPAGVDRRRAPGTERGRTPGAERGRTPGTERQRVPQGGRQQTTPSGGAAPSRTTAPATGTGRAPATGGAAPVIIQPPATGGQPVVQPSPGGEQRPVTRGRPSSRGDVYRGRDVQRTEPASQSGYGGYGTGRDATIYRQRGESSRENMRHAPRPIQTPGRSTAPVVAPAPQPAAVPSRPAPHFERSSPAIPQAPRAAPVAPRAAPVAPSAAPMAPRSAPVSPSVPSPRGPMIQHR